MGIALIVLLVNADAKSFVLRQIMLTGLFNVNINKDASDTSDGANVVFSFEGENGAVQNTASLKNKVAFINFWASRDAGNNNYLITTALILIFIAE